VTSESLAPTTRCSRGVVPTSDDEMSMYVQRRYGQPSTYIERLTLRTDGIRLGECQVSRGRSGDETDHLLGGMTGDQSLRRRRNPRLRSRMTSTGRSRGILKDAALCTCSGSTDVDQQRRVPALCVHRSFHGALQRNAFLGQRIYPG